MFHAGLRAVDEAYRILVSAELPLFDPKADYFRYAGQPLRPRLTAPAYPDQDYFAEHRRRVFRWPATKPR